MTGKVKYNIEVNADEVATIDSLLRLLDDCTIPLTNDDYVSIFRAIANQDEDVDDIDGLKFLYVDHEESEKDKITNAVQELDEILKELPCNIKGCSATTKMSCDGCPEYYDWINKLKGEGE